MTPEERDAAALEKELQAIQQRENAPQRVKAPRENRPPRPDISDARRELHRVNRALPASQVLAQMKEQIHACWVVAEVVGRWIWCTLPEKPSQEVRDKLYDLGFSWNFKRRTWQNPCGAFMNHSNGDPREKYISAKATELDSGTVILDSPAPAAKKKELQPA
jgi:hypothetical protein